MSFRDETRELPCGCKIGRSKGGMWFYDYICEIHLPEILENGKYSYKKAEELVKKLNEEIKTYGIYGVDVVLEEKKDKDKGRNES